MFVSLWLSQISNSWTYSALWAFIIDRATCWATSRDGVAAEQSPGCVFRPQRVRVETDKGVKGSYSLLKALHKSKWLTWRTHDAGISHTWTWIHKHSGIHTQTHLFFICHTHICVCTLVRNKAGCLLFTGCGNRFASMCSLSHEGRGIQKEM